MKRLAHGLIAGLLACVLALSVTACDDQATEANAAIDASNQAIQEANLHDEEAGRAFTRIRDLEPGSEGSEAAEDLIAKAEDSVRLKNEQVQRAIDELSKIESLDVSGDLKTYAWQQVEIANLQKESNELLLEAIGEFRRVFSATESSGTVQTRDEGLDRIDEILSEVDGLSKRIDEKAGASDLFYQEKGLGSE